ncbi:MAG: squalene/phytoene synthase family protein [Polymorphobacter sp.]|uniref:squalene/phytoene synthase family protein n=1 Tax=Polymorphobacter sp. TaxID=1909290 RepID=UPI003A8C432A
MTGLANELRARERELWLATLYAPEAVRPALVALFALDRVLAEVAETVSDPMVGAIRLAWWRDALLALDGAAKAPDEPHLQAAAAFLLPQGLGGAELAALEERWGCRLAGDLDADAERAAEAEGGARLFALAGRLLGGDETLAAALGRGWAVGELWQGRVSAALRPLLGLAVLGVRDARDAAAGRARAARGGAGRQLRMLWAVASGR